MTLDELRRHLDELDRQLLQIIAERQATSREIARVKRATGYPTPSLSRTGGLPAGVTFSDNGDGSATIAGTPAKGRVFTLTLSAANGTAPRATQVFTLTIGT